MKSLILCLILITMNLNAQSNVAFLDAPSLENSTSKTTLENTTNKSFELIGGMIFIEATVNGKSGNFILDTGAPGIILNDVPTKTSDEIMASGIGGQLNIGEVNIHRFEWGIINLTKIQGYTLDISHLEKSFGKDIAGLIGFDVLKDFELLFDYQNQVIQILNPKKNELHKHHKPLKKIAFQKQGHLPVIQVKIGKKAYHFGLDSGAEVNLLDAKILDKIDKNVIANLQQESIVGLENAPKTVQTATIKKTTLKSIEFPAMKYLFVDFSEVNQNNDLKIDGLLGFTFLKKSKISINYKKQILYIWK